MEIKAIDKALELLKKGLLPELDELLNYERGLEILKSKSTKPNLLKAVKKVLDDKNLLEARPNLRNIQIDKNDMQFICNGYLFVRWHTHKEELDCLPQLEKEHCINLSCFIRKPFELKEFKITDDEKLVINNIDKYIKINKQKGKRTAVKLFNEYWDAELIKMLFDIIGYNQDYIYKETDSATSSIHIFNSDSNSMILPLRIIGEDSQEIDTMYNDFVKQLKNN